MRENRQSGSEGGGTETNRFSLPLSRLEMLSVPVGLPLATEGVADMVSTSR